MKLTKFQHACFVVEEGKATIVVDPGTYSHDFIAPRRIDGIIITHEHPDHLDETLVASLLKSNPKATIIGHESITARYPNASTLPVTPGTVYPFAGLQLEFFGGTHAPIAEGVTTPPNLGVLINEHFYYPGDSFAVPSAKTITHLMLPVSAPWLDFARTRDFLAQVKPHFVFPTHDGILSEDGKQLAEKMVGGFAQTQGIIYTRLDGKSVELS